MRLDPLFVRKPPYVLPGLGGYIPLLIDARLNSAYTIYRSAERELPALKNAPEAAKYVAGLRDEKLNTFKQLVGSLSKMKDNPGKEVKVAFKQLADIFESSVGAIHEAYGIGACELYMKSFGVIKEIQKKDAVVVPEDVAEIAERLYEAQRLERVEEILGYHFSCRTHLVRALTHPSYTKGIGGYQRYEFLGDAVLEYLVTRYLFESYKYAEPGLLTSLKFEGLNNNLFAYIVARHKLNDFLMVDSGELKRDIDKYVKEVQKDGSDLDSLEPVYVKVLADAFEALVGAVYLDTNNDVEKTQAAIWHMLGPELKHYATPEYAESHRNPKTILCDLLAKYQKVFGKDLVVHFDRLSKETIFHIFIAELDGIVILAKRVEEQNSVTKRLFYKKLIARVLKIGKEFDARTDKDAKMKTFAQKHAKDPEHAHPLIVDQAMIEI